MEIVKTDILIIGENINSFYLSSLLKGHGRDILLLSQNRTSMLTNPVFRYYKENEGIYRSLNKNISNLLTELGFYHKPFFSPVSVINPFGDITECAVILETHNFYEYAKESGLPLNLFIFENVENCPDIPKTDIFKFEKTSLRVLNHNRLYTPYEVARILDEDSEAVLNIAKNIRQNLKDKSVLVLPPILGIDKTEDIIKTIKEITQNDVFESIPLDPAIQSRRLFNRLNTKFERRGINRIYSKKLKVEGSNSRIKSIITDSLEIQPDTVVIMTERFIEEGLTIRDNKVVEPIFNLPVFFDRDKNELSYFTEEDIFADHNIYNCGIKVDESFSPLDIFNNTIFENLKCCGSIIKGQRDNLLSLYNTHRLSEILIDGGKKG